MEQQKYYKVIGNNFGKFPYKLGLNTLAENKEEFNPDPVCGAGGLYFCTIKNIFSWIEYGDRVCELSIPDGARVVAVKDKFEADKIFIERIFPFDIEELAELGADVDRSLYLAVTYGNVSLVRKLIENGASVNILDNKILIATLIKGDIHTVNCLIEYGVNMGEHIDYALLAAVQSGRIELVKYCVEKCADVRAKVTSALIPASKGGNLNVVKYLVEQGADIHALNDRALRFAAKKDIST